LSSVLMCLCFEKRWITAVAITVSVRSCPCVPYAIASICNRARKVCWDEGICHVTE
jgi:hypothetical protein